MRADDIRIPEPCHEDWGRMLPEERGWHCRLCSKHVHDLSAMTETQVRALMRSGQDICVAYDVTNAGEIVFQPEPIVPIARLVRRPVGAAAAGLALALAACTPHGEEPSQTVKEDLRRFKALMEAGEIPTTDGQPSGRAKGEG